MGKLFDNPLPLIIIVILALLLFGAPKLPGMARSVGQSLRIFKSEVHQMKDDADPRYDGGSATADSEAGPSPHTGRSGSTDGTTDTETTGPPSSRSS